MNPSSEHVAFVRVKVCVEHQSIKRLVGEILRRLGVNNILRNFFNGSYKQAKKNTQKTNKIIQ